MNTVLVMMSTYNGEKYIEEQVDSILAQEGVAVKLLVRDDGSKDKTIEILEKYKNAGKLTWYHGTNLKSCGSFLDLLFNCGDYEYYAFADQDDYWHKNKLAQAIRKLKGIDSDVPKLYFCKKNIVDDKLKPMDRGDTKVNNVSYNAAILNCVASGCTMVFNHKTAELVRQYKPQNATMHDSWVYKVVNALGKVIYDDNAYIDYRQHGGNVVGADNKFSKRLTDGFKSLNKRKYMTYRSQGAAEMYKAYGNALCEEYEELTKLLMEAPNSFKARLKLVFSRRLSAQTNKELFFIKVFVLLGWI